MTATDFRVMVARHSDYLKPYAITLTRDADDAKDLYQETVLRALLNEDKYNFGTNLKAWLYTIMRNIFINNYRRNKKLTKVDNGDSLDIAVHTEALTTQNQGWGHLRMGEINAAIAKLPGTSRLCFELHYTGYKYQEIAHMLQEPLGTIKSRIHFARKQLTAQLDR